MISNIYFKRRQINPPITRKGIKVCLSMFGSNGVGLANLSKETAISVAKEIKYYVETYGLDGVDFDDEWADYKNIIYKTPIKDLTLHLEIIMQD